MGCVKRGDLRAFLDAELTGSSRTRVEEHLVSCASCRQDLEELRVNASFARSSFDRMVPTASVPRIAWSRIRDRADSRGPVTLSGGFLQMVGHLFGFVNGSRIRMAASTAAVLGIVALLFTLSPVQTLASSVLSVFRVQKFVAVQVDPTSLPKVAKPGDLGSFTTTGSESPRVVSAAEAERVTGIKLPTPRVLPTGLAPAGVSVTGAHSTTFVPDLKKVRAYLDSIGASSVKLPDNLDGAPITLTVPAGVMQIYLEKGAAQRNSEGVPVPAVGQRFLYVGATTSPTLNVPDGLDVDRIRAEVLAMPGLPPDLVNQIKAIDDWRNTLVVPVVKGTSHQVTVRGQTGLVISQPDGKGTTLIWTENGVVYAFSGSVTEQEILAAANSIS